jgi:hypothetical protein
MLELAYANREELQKKFLEIAFQEKYKYYNFTPYTDYEYKASDSSWASLEFVSKKDGIIIGYLSAKIAREINAITSLKVVNFYDKNIEFSRDFHRFLTDLFVKYCFRKINFCVAIGNPAEQMYDKYIRKYNGRIVGIYRDDTKLWDDQYCDVKLYEIMRINFIKLGGTK